MEERVFMYKKYYGTKSVEAKPGNNAGSGESGYHVKYEGGYVSWSPKEVFEKAYQLLTAMSFGHAIEAMKAGEKVRRDKWNENGRSIDLQRYWSLDKTDMLANDWQIVTD